MTTSETVKSEKVKSEQVKSEQVKSEQVKSEQVKSEQVKSDQVKSEQVKSEQVKSEQVNQSKLNQSKLNLNLNSSFLKWLLTVLATGWKYQSISNSARAECVARSDPSDKIVSRAGKHVLDSLTES